MQQGHIIKSDSDIDDDIRQIGERTIHKRAVKDLKSTKTIVRGGG